MADERNAQLLWWALSPSVSLKVMGRFYSEKIKNNFSLFSDGSESENICSCYGLHEMGVKLPWD